MLGQQGGHDPEAQPARATTLGAGTHGPEETCRRVEERLTASGITYKEKSTAYAYRVYVLDRCLTSDDHTDGAAIIVFPSGAVSYRCLHNRCQGKGWADVREVLGFRTEPAAPVTATPNGASHGRGVTSVIHSLASGTPLPEVPPFPTHVLPPIVRRYVSEAAKAIGVPDDLVAVPFCRGGRVHWLDRIHRAEAGV